MTSANDGGFYGGKRKKWKKLLGLAHSFLFQPMRWLMKLNPQPRRSLIDTKQQNESSLLYPGGVRDGRGVEWGVKKTWLENPAKENAKRQ
ncbi:MAG: hypothetical protein ACO27R_02625 [Hylemonella sp.]